MRARTTSRRLVLPRPRVWQGDADPCRRYSAGTGLAATTNFDQVQDGIADAPASAWQGDPQAWACKKAKFRNLHAEQLVAHTHSRERTVAGLRSKTFKPARARPANVAPVMTSKWLA